MCAYNDTYQSTSAADVYVELTMLHMQAACKLLTVPADTQSTQACAIKANEQKAQVGANKG